MDKNKAKELKSKIDYIKSSLGSWSNAYHSKSGQMEPYYNYSIVIAFVDDLKSEIENSYNEWKQTKEKPKL